MGDNGEWQAPYAGVIDHAAADLATLSGFEDPVHLLGRSPLFHFADWWASIWPRSSC
jgi:hypothetical protein